MKAVSLDLLDRSLRFFRDHHPEGQADIDFVSYGAATQYLQNVIGNDWSNQMVFAEHPTVSRPNRLGRKFMRADSEETENLYRNRERTLRIAELLFNLQLVEGIDGRLDDIRVGKVESTYAELEAGEFFLRRGLPFKFVDETGVKGLDYDIQISLRSGEKVNCETKCKIESTELSGGAIHNVLSKARRQLPPDKPGLVLLKIPELWTFDPTASSLLSAVINDFLRSTSRVVAVVLRWEELYVEKAEAGARVVYQYRVDRGTQPKDVSTEIQNLLTRLSGPKTAEWVSFRAKAADAFEEAV